MTLFTVDTNKCMKDGACAAECPVSIISMEHGLPEPVEGADRLCINCGHCMAVCPAGAFTLSTMDPAACPEVEADRLPSAEAFALLARARRSIRVYRKKPIEREKLVRLLDTARYAPTAKNTQLISWTVVTGKEALEGLAAGTIDWMRDLMAKKDPLAAAYGMKRLVAAWEKGFNPVLRGAPCLVATHAPEKYRGGVIDSTIALTTFELAATTEGLGCCWAGFFFIAASQWPPLREILDLPTGEAVTGAMMAGYPQHHFKRIPLRNEAKVTWR